MKYTYTETQEIKHEIELKSCPFCGSDDIYVHHGHKNGFSGYAIIGCNDCGASIEQNSNNIGYGDTIEGLRDVVIGNWNARHRSTGIDDRIKSLKKCLSETVGCIEALSEKMGVQHQLKLQPDYIEWKKELNK